MIVVVCRSVCAASSRHQRAFSTNLSRRFRLATFLACSSQSAAWARNSSALDSMGSSKCLLVTPTQILPPVVALNLFNIEHVKIGGCTSQARRIGQARPDLALSIRKELVGLSPDVIFAATNPV